MPEIAPLYKTDPIDIERCELEIASIAEQP